MLQRCVGRAHIDTRLEDLPVCPVEFKVSGRKLTCEMRCCSRSLHIAYERRLAREIERWALRRGWLEDIDDSGHFVEIVGLRYKVDTNHDIVYIEFDEPTLSIREIRAIFLKLGLEPLIIGAVPPELQTRTKTERLSV